MNVKLSQLGRVLMCPALPFARFFFLFLFLGLSLGTAFAAAPGIPTGCSIQLDHVACPSASLEVINFLADRPGYEQVQLLPPSPTPKKPSR